MEGGKESCTHAVCPFLCKPFLSPLRAFVQTLIHNPYNLYPTLPSKFVCEFAAPSPTPASHKPLISLQVSNKQVRLQHRGSMPAVHLHNVRRSMCDSTVSTVVQRRGESGIAVRM
jgi:hypothetical protein